MAILKPLSFQLVLSMLLIACNGRNNQPTKLTYIKYISHYEYDSAVVVINKSKKIFSGYLRIGNGGDNIDSGQVKGVVKGDTLIGEFHFKHYQLEWKRKPVAFLVKKDTLVMGEGLMKLTVGIPHFDPSVPIDFKDKKRLVFVRSDQ
ncbi:hypothetical protein [Pedobacter xixiisoli]|uniref:Lipoprotein n=1 Tax=Pedobacter xixiisoli TaxID=1476464 RepID=A0A285ZRT9_9SPHI|nr:hypothetical protein [Pedobacter xixiisoli]SOD12373.1 hypothetical protein SAMN06297358_0632 [Pedobacter xixiisoli]